MMKQRARADLPLSKKDLAVLLLAIDTLDQTLFSISATLQELREKGFESYVEVDRLNGYDRLSLASLRFHDLELVSRSGVDAAN